MKYLLAILILLFCANANAIVVGQQQSVGGWVCDSGTTAISYEDTTDTGVTSLGTDAHGQSFTPSVDTPLHSIEVYWGYASGCAATIRIGTSNDLTTYIASATVSGDGTGWSTPFDMSTDEITLTGSTKYYIGIVETGGDCRWTYERSDGYTDGNEIYSSSGWVMDGNSSYDKLFRVNSCD